MEQSIVFIDCEIGVENHKIYDIGAVDQNGNQFHSPNPDKLRTFVANADYFCGHNIIHHDMKFLRLFLPDLSMKMIDTLYLSPLLFPKKPYHALLKDDKLYDAELNNPLDDAKKAEELLYDEVNAFSKLPNGCQRIYYELLGNVAEFSGFFQYMQYRPKTTGLEKISTYVRGIDRISSVASLIRNEFAGLVCKNANLEMMIERYPVELAYTLALIRTKDTDSITPPWLLKNFPALDNVIRALCNTPCSEGCDYCRNRLDVREGLKKYFHFDSFRTYNGEPLQEKAAQAAVNGKSLIAVFPTGGGKSITFQLPALMAGTTVRGLTVVISPLLSLMKDQVDNLNDAGISDAITINGMLNPVERADAYERLANGTAKLLYISPEQLRSRTIEKMLLSRNVVRFVIDEAHCFSAWGQDFRVDYLYIGDFIKLLQQKKQLDEPIPVSCFTATAKQKVISDIRDYFKKKLDLDLELYATTATRKNLHYNVIFKETEEEKYITLRGLIEAKKCPTIVYVSSTKKTVKLAQKLTADGIPARPFHGKMEAQEKIENQEAFKNNEISVIVATSAFGMGVDKKDVKLVIHYEISDSLENYIQEAGRAGRDPALQAECYVLYNDNDLDKHFALLNQAKLSISEIQQVWKAIKEMTKQQRSRICCSPLEIVRQAGWDDNNPDMETRVKTAVAALENAGYIKRGQNVPHVYATSILAKNQMEAAARIEKSSRIPVDQRTNAKRIIQSLISSRSIANAKNDEAESRVDYLADRLGIPMRDVINLINIMREDGLLADTQDMSAYIFGRDTQSKTIQTTEKFINIERFLLEQIKMGIIEFNLKDMNGKASEAHVTGCSVKKIRTILHYLSIKGYIKKTENLQACSASIEPLMEYEKMTYKFNKRESLCRFIVEYLYQHAEVTSGSEETLVQFSLLKLVDAYSQQTRIDMGEGKINRHDVEDALLYLSKIGAMRLEGGFLVTYNGMEINRLEMDNRIQYKRDDYAMLNEFYKQKIRQIHIVGEYANLMVKDYDAALEFVQDYFQLDFKKFISKYFKGTRATELDHNITTQKYQSLFGDLSKKQAEIINDHDSQYIVVAAGPGSGKTKVLAHKLAALVLMEDVKYEQLLMVTFSRAAATEFKIRLRSLIGASAASFIDIKTFHSYCFDLLGKIGSLNGVENVVSDAAEMIRSGEVEPDKIAKSVLVIDEAQDMDSKEFQLVQALMQANPEMRVIAVGDDDQNIYSFRGSDSKYLKSFMTVNGAKKYEMEDNYRSAANIVEFSNAIAHTMCGRMKSSDVRPVKKVTGEVVLTHHCCKSFEQAVVDDYLGNKKCGTTCFLTSTNEEALQIQELLLKKKIRAKLIQSADGFCLLNLAEIRYFLMIIDRELKSPVIDDADWRNAKSKLSQQYANSDCLRNCLNMLDEFEKTVDKKYRTDLEEFIRESHYEDFYSDDPSIVTVSTIHKAKGKEFKNVYIMLDNIQIQQEEEKRKLYVGLTRAEEVLHVHYSGNLFDDVNVGSASHMEDSKVYKEPDEIILQLTHRDVVLDYFKDKKDKILRLKSGMTLAVRGSEIFAENTSSWNPILKLSKTCRIRIRELERRGYAIYSAKIRFIVAWKGQKDTEETAVLLPDIRMKKQRTS